VVIIISPSGALFSLPNAAGISLPGAAKATSARSKEGASEARRNFFHFSI
jgi:hypothetical protein